MGTLSGKVIAIFIFTAHLSEGNFSDKKFEPPGAVSFFTLRIDDPFERASYSRKASNQSQSCCPFFKMAENVVLYSSTLKALSALPSTCKALP